MLSAEKISSAWRAKSVFSHTVQVEETERGKLRAGRDRDWVHGNVAWKGIVI